MIKKILIVCLFISFLQFNAVSYAASLFDANIEAAITSAESFFKTMKNKNYPKIWNMLTNRSKEVIVDDVLKAETKAGFEYSKEKINNDFKSGGQLSKIYWNSFLDNFNPDLILEQSKWDTGKFEKDRGEIIIKYRKAERPAILSMFKEENAWKVGLVETFWTRKK